MSFKFKCHDCGKYIIVKFLRPGEEALCRNCGSYEKVPKDATETDEEPDYLKTEPEAELKTQRATVEESVLGPKSVLRILLETLSVYKKHSIALITANAVTDIPMYVVIYLIGMFLGWEVGNARWALLDPAAMLTLIVVLILGVVIATALKWGAFVVLIAQHYNGKRLDVARAYSVSWQRLWSVAGASLIFVICLSLGAIVSGFFGVVFGLLLGSTLVMKVLAAAAFVIVILGLARLYVFPGCAILEDKNAVTALVRSNTLVTDNCLRMVTVAGTIVSLIALVAGFTSFVRAAPMIAIFFLSPLLPVALLVSYFELRVRKENYSPQDLATEFATLAQRIAASPLPHPKIR